MVDTIFDNDRNGSSAYTKVMQEKLISVQEDWVKEWKLLSKISETNNTLDFSKDGLKNVYMIKNPKSYHCQGASFRKTGKP